MNKVNLKFIQMPASAWPASWKATARKNVGMLRIKIEIRTGRELFVEGTPDVISFPAKYPKARPTKNSKATGKIFAPVTLFFIDYEFKNPPYK